jgi:hypothetical protein
MKIENIEQIIKLFERSTVSKMEIESGDLKIKLEKEVGDTTTFVRVPTSSTVKPIEQVETVSGTSSKLRWSEPFTHPPIRNPHLLFKSENP